MNMRYPAIICLTLSLLMLSVLAAAVQGTFSLSWLDVLKGATVCVWSDQCEITAIQQQILLDIRLPRIFMALLTGAGLAITGAVLQSVTRNPLADPYLFGISSGAALGAVLAMSLSTGAIAFAGIGSAFNVTTGALAGGAVSVFLMLSLAGKSSVHVEKLLLSGVAVSFMLSAFTSLVIYYSTPETASTLLFWLIGSFSGVNWSDLLLPLITVAFGSAIFFIFSRWLLVMQLGEESAATLGVPVHALRLGMLLVSSAITAVLVAEVGGIGFVGLMIPHIVRLLVGNQFQRVLLMSLLTGAIFMIWVDVLAHSLLSHQVLPVGIVTSALGSIFFFIILKRRQSR